MKKLLILLSMVLILGCDDTAEETETVTPEEVSTVTETITEDILIVESIVDDVITVTMESITVPETEEITTVEIEVVEIAPVQIEIIMEDLQMTILPIAEYDFFWKTESGGVTGYKFGEFEPVTISEELEGEPVTTKPFKAFFTLNGVLYFSADFTEANPDYVAEAEEPVSQFITVEKYFKQIKGSSPEEITALPDMPAVERLVVDDGIYSIVTNAYEEVPVSDLYRAADSKYCGRNYMIAGYFYGACGETTEVTNKGAFIDVQNGIPGLREPGLYFVSDRFTMQIQIAEAGRMWIY